MKKTLLKALKGLCVMNFSLLSNLFTKVENNYHIGNGGMLVQLQIPDKESAEVFANVFKQQRIEEQKPEIQDNPPTSETNQ